MIEKLKQIAEEAGKLILEVYNSDDFNVKVKEDNSPLTEADKRSHNYIVEELKKNFREYLFYPKKVIQLNMKKGKTGDIFFSLIHLTGQRNL